MKLQGFEQLRHRGVALLYVLVAVVAMCAVGSLALDYGRAQVVKTELRRAAEAAAFAALAEIRSGNGIAAAQNAAVSVAGSNLADGSSIVVDPDADVEFGSYNVAEEEFTVLSGTARASATAIHVTCRRTTARGTAVPLVLGPVIGKNSVDVTADAVAAVNTPSRFNIVGLDSVSIDNLDIDSFDSSVGAYGGANVKGNAAIASNGNLTFAGSTHHHTEAHPGPSGTITKDGGTELGTKSPFATGNYPVLSPYTANLSSALYYPLPDASAYVTSNDNSQLASKLDASNNLTINADTTITGGTFYINNWTQTDKKLTLNSKTVFYVTGNINMDGEILTYLTNPVNLSIYMLSSGTTFTYTRDKKFYGTLYAPLSDISWTNGERYGMVVGKTLYMKSKKFHFDEALANGSEGGPAKKKWIKKPQKWIR